MKSNAPRHRDRLPGSPIRGVFAADVVIIGAGAAGLAAARDLVQRGVSVIVLEARTVSAAAHLFHTTPKTLTRRMRAFHMHNWTTDPFAGGAYSHVRVGGIDAPKTLSRSVEGTIYLAGEAYDAEGRNGTVEGAIASGRRAASRIVHR
jgi:monoamine oxidase